MKTIMQTTEAAAPTAPPAPAAAPFDPMAFMAQVSAQMKAVEDAAKAQTAVMAQMAENLQALATQQKAAVQLAAPTVEKTHGILGEYEARVISERLKNIKDPEERRQEMEKAIRRVRAYAETNYNVEIEPIHMFSTGEVVMWGLLAAGGAAAAYYYGTRQGEERAASHTMKISEEEARMLQRHRLEQGGEADNVINMLEAANRRAG